MKKIIFKQNVGVDVSKDDIEATLSNLTTDYKTEVLSTRKFSNTVDGFKDLRKWAERQKRANMPIGFTMEATGVYYESLAYFLHENGCHAYVVLPNLAKKYGQSLGLKSKTDKLDARTLSQLGLERELRLWAPFSPVMRELKQVTRERETLTCLRTRVCNHLHAHSHQGKPNSNSIARLKEHVEFIDVQIKQIDNEIKKIVNRDEALKKRIGYLLSIPGVGLLTAATVVAETNGFSTFENIKQATSFAGLDVRIQESGIWKGKSKISKRGNSHIRKALFMPALSKKTHDSKTKQFYDRLKAKKGVGMIAAVAVERKLLGLMFSLWKKEEMYDAA